MYGFYVNYNATSPSIVIQSNCDNILAINLGLIDIDNADEIIFTLKNYDYTASPHIFIFKASKSDADENGEVIFKIPAATTKELKPGAFYNIATLINSHSISQETVYNNIVSKGKILLAYGAQDLAVNTDLSATGYEIVDVRLERID